MADVTGSQMVALTEVEVEDSPGASVVVVSGVIPALVVIGVFATIMLVLRARLRRAESSARHILDRRLAAGEVTPDEYRELRSLLAAPD
jgi:uncharacterized membrane protein